MEIISRKDAKSLGLTHYFTNKPCKHGHISKRFTLSGACCVCQSLSRPSKEYVRVYRERTGKTSTEAVRKWREQNKQLNRERSAAWGRANKKYRSEQMKKWRKENPERAKASLNSRRRALREQSPPWVNKVEIRTIYQNCPDGYHVDHIFPLKGVTPEGWLCCGLHIPINLQYLPAFENQSKNNRVQPEDINEIL